jgi:hypothetical protein
LSPDEEPLADGAARSAGSTGGRHSFCCAPPLTAPMAGAAEQKQQKNYIS